MRFWKKQLAFFKVISFPKCSEPSTYTYIFYLLLSGDAASSYGGGLSLDLLRAAQLRLSPFHFKVSENHTVYILLLFYIVHVRIMLVDAVCVGDDRKMYCAFCVVLAWWMVYLFSCRFAQCRQNVWLNNYFQLASMNRFCIQLHSFGDDHFLPMRACE